MAWSDVLKPNGRNKIRINLWFIVVAMFMVAEKEIEFFEGINNAHYEAIDADTPLARIEADNKYTHNIIGATAFGILFTLLGGIAIRLVDEKPQPGPTVPLEVHQRALDLMDNHRSDLAKIAHGNVLSSAAIGRLEKTADNLESGNENE